MSQDPNPSPLKGAPRPLRGRVRKLRNKSARWLGQHFGAAAIVQMARCCRKIELNGDVRERAEAEHKGLILAFWHGRGVLASPFYRPGNTTALVSASEDGSMATTILKRLTSVDGGGAHWQRFETLPTKKEKFVRDWLGLWPQYSTEDHAPLISTCDFAEHHRIITNRL